MKSIILIFLVCLPHFAIAESYKCTQSGRTIYSSTPCGNNAQVVQDHISVTDAPRIIYQKPLSAQMVPPQPKAAPVLVTEQVISCNYQVSEVEYVNKTMRAGYPASQSNYWHERYRKAVEAYELCRKEQQNSLEKK